MKTITDLITAAAKINEYAGQYTIATHPIRYATGTSAALASAIACLSDDDGGPIADPNHQPNGTLRLTVDIEHFREHGRTQAQAGRQELANADQAEDNIAQFCRSLGFQVAREDGVGSGEYGRINQISLT